MSNEKITQNEPHYNPDDGAWDGQLPNPGIAAVVGPAVRSERPHASRLLAGFESSWHRKNWIIKQGLKHVDLVVLLIIEHHANWNTGACILNQKVIAAEAGLEHHAAMRAIRRLVAGGYLFMENRHAKGRASLYILTIPEGQPDISGQDRPLNPEFIYSEPGVQRFGTPGSSTLNPEFIYSEPGVQREQLGITVGYNSLERTVEEEQLPAPESAPASSPDFSHDSQKPSALETGPSAPELPGSPAPWRFKNPDADRLHESGELDIETLQDLVNADRVTVRELEEHARRCNCPARAVRRKWTRREIAERAKKQEVKNG